ncbi:MAG: hypothetical protein Q9221_008352 [Calogaya cf. arnoldii]
MSEFDWTAVGPRFEQPLRPGFPKGRKICLRHPGYPDILNTLLYFPAYDHGSGGLHLGVALAACAIVAGNKFDGYLTASEDRADQAVPHDVNRVLAGNNYYFHPHSISTTPQCQCHAEPYPIFPTFDEWPFPHEHLPAWWPNIEASDEVMTSCSQSGLYAGVRRRDNACRLTASRELLETAHVIPAKELTWFNKNNMVRYTYDARSIINSANLFMLRKDIHTAYDAHKWAIVPKSSKWVYQHLDTAPELGSLFHNIELYPIEGLRTEYLFARFALAVFPMLNAFLTNMAPKRLLGELAGIKDASGIECSGQWCLEQFPAPGTRSGRSSPTKNNKRPAPLDHDLIEHDSTYDSGSQHIHDINIGPTSHKRRRSLSCGTYQDKHTLSHEPDILCPYKQVKTVDSQSKTWANPYLCGPCRCPEPSTAASEHTICNQTEEPPAFCFSDLKCLSQQCRTMKDLERLEIMRQELLREERKKSGVDAWWQEQLQWQNKAIEGGMSGGNVDRYRWMMGQEVFDDDGEHLDLNMWLVHKTR